MQALQNTTKSLVLISFVIKGLILLCLKHGEGALTFEQKKSAGLHHTPLRFATTFYRLWEAYA